jgi:hypothetical protein
MSVRRLFPLSGLAKVSPSPPARGKATSVFCVLVRASSRTSRVPNLPVAGAFSLRVVISLYSQTGSRLIHHLRTDGTYHFHQLADPGPPNLLRWRESVTPVCLLPGCVHNVHKAV